MKAQFLTACLATLTSTLFAQIQPGERLYGGSVSSRNTYSHNLNTDVKNNSSFTASAVQLTVGKFRQNNWLTGINMSLGLSPGSNKIVSAVGGQNNYESGTRYLSYAVSLNPFVRRYWELNNIQLFVGGGIGVSVSGFYSRDKEFPAEDYTFSGNRMFGFGISPSFEAGLNYFVTKHLALELKISTNAFPVSFGQLGAGFIYRTGDHALTLDNQAQTNQTKKGGWLPGGSFSISNTSVKTPGERNLTYDPGIYKVSLSAGKFIRERTVLGIEAGYQYTERRTEGENASVSKSKWFSVVPYVQTYWLTSRLTPFHRISASWSKLVGAQGNTFGLNGQFGLAYMLGERFIIETSLASVGVDYSRLGNSYETISPYASASLGNQFALRYVFR
ncbi:hypothetical protein [Arsenicibacter rosenii]|uniref:Outer membrane protein beta-barrel domain-containing protein n=1 Tax=Arsenicibacter rosenii TaxID=1750698 RepID=A0A1S2VIT5_9BACT|nr:hypothetical protein [Arsenicibacter rosenii]OIN58677.1 hypothetical protein BLX24_14030 [Arsenicibacter rosenii]